VSRVVVSAPIFIGINPNGDPGSEPLILLSRKDRARPSGFDVLQARKISAILATLLILALTGAAVDSSSENKSGGNIISWKSRFPIVVMAHRGFSGKAPENTLASFQKAIEAGSDFIELDVRFSKDGHLAVFHDDTLERTTNGKGKVADKTLGQLRALDAGSWFGSAAFAGERIPTFQEVLEFTRGRILINVELKKGEQGTYTMTDLADRALEEVLKAGMGPYVLFSSFDLGAVGRISEKKTGIPAAFITGNPWSSATEAFGGRPLAFLNPRKTVLNEKNLAAAHQEGVKVFVWTVDDEQEMRKFISMGVDGIISNHPDRLIRVLEQEMSPTSQISNPK
jgi:glycerophosphoryl diester phosphodiesterase